MNGTCSIWTGCGFANGAASETFARIDRRCADLLDAVVINTGPEAYRRRDGIAVVPAALLGH